MPPKRYFEQAEAAPNEMAPSESKDAKPSSTLFVSSLPYSATTTDLQTLFSDIGPLKRAFVVTDQQTKKSKGVGYVTFALVEDAKAALEQLQGKSLDGGSRKIQIMPADHRDPIKARKTATADADAAPSAKRPRVHQASAARPTRTKAEHSEKDADAVRTVVLSGLAGCSPMPDSKQIYKRTRKIGDVDNVIYPNPSSPKPEDVAHVIFRTPNHAMTAVEKLHAHIFKGVQISAILKKRADNAARIAAHMRPETLAKREQIRQDIEKQSGRGTMPVLLSDVDKSSRLIVRNLSYDVNEADLRAIFLPLGPIYEITIPKVKAKLDDTTSVNETRTDSSTESSLEDDEDDLDDDDDDDDSDDDVDGVEEEEEGGDVLDDDNDAAASASSVDNEHAEASDSGEDSPVQGLPEEAGKAGALPDLNDQEENETVTLPSTPISSGKASTAKAPTEKGRGFAFVWMVSKNDAARAIEAVNGKAIQHGAAERAAYKTAKGSKGRRFAKANLDRVREHAQPERVVAVDWSLSKKDWEAKAEQSDVEGEVNERDDEEEAVEDEDEPAEKPKLPEPEEGTTLFIRNLPYQATEDELRNLFRQFGPLRYARITIDKLTNRSKGTGFVCFWQVESAEAALQQAHIIEKESGVGGSSSSSSVANLKNPFAMSSVLTADPAAPLTASLNLHGRVLNVIPAVARGEATKLETSGRKEREKGDKRNTWLLREGVPFPSSEFAARLAPSEVEKRLQSFQVRKAQMGANPSLFISKTRLSVRSLPLFVSERMLKRLAIHSIKAFGAEVRAGSREDLDADEKADRTLSASIENRKRKPGERPTSVIQTKVVRQNDRIEALTGIGKSKGYGFLEMKSFNEALKVVRWANGNKDIAKLFGEWWQDDLQTQIDRVATQIQAKTKILDSKKGEDADAAKVEIEDLDLRKKRLRMKLKELQDGSVGGDKAERGGMLMIEFAIENVVTTKKRADKIKAIKDSAVRRQEREEQDAKAEKVNLEQQRMEAQAARKIEVEASKPRGSAHGHVIGKKRKERKSRRN